MEIEQAPLFLTAPMGSQGVFQQNQFLQDWPQRSRWLKHLKHKAEAKRPHDLDHKRKTGFIQIGGCIQNQVWGKRGYSVWFCGPGLIPEGF